MKKVILLSWLLILSAHFVNAQTLFKGVVLNEQTKQPISYAKIGVSDQGVGVITNANGRFNYKKYSKTLDRDSKLVITAKGYEDVILGVEELREMYNLNATILLKPGSNKTEERKNAVSVFWDISEGMIDRDQDKEFAFLEKHLSQFKKINVNFVVFNNKIQSWKQEEIMDGDISRFRESLKDISYEGPANYDVLQTSGIDEILLFSNGDPTFGTLDVDRNIPVYAIVTTANLKEKALNEITSFTEGKLVSLHNVDIASIQKSSKNVNSQVVKSVAQAKGIVSSLGNPIQGATVSKLGTFEEALTDSKGSFEIEAKTGDILAINYLGMFEKRVVVDGEKAFEIEMIPESDVLDEVVLKGTKKEIIVGNKIMKGRPNEHFPGGTVGFGDFYITAEDIVPNARTLDQVLLQNFKVVQILNTPTQGPVIAIRGRVPSYVVNGFLLEPGVPAPLYISDTEIESLVVKYGDERTSRYTPGRLLGGVAVIVTTKKSALVQKTDKYNPLVKGNDYEEEVKLSSEAIISTSSNTITGKVTSLGKPIQGAIISKKGTFDEASTASDGSFSIEGSNGDRLAISYLGMYTKFINIEDATASLSVDLLPKSDVLDEVEISGRSREVVKSGVDIESNRYRDPFLGSHDVFIITNEEFKIDNWVNIATGLQGRVSNVQVDTTPGREQIVINNEPAKFFIDGRPVDIIELIALPPQRVETIAIKKNIVGVIGVGVRGRAIFVDTKKAIKRPKPGSALVTNNEYKEEIKSLPKAVISATRSSRGNSIKQDVNSAATTVKGKVTSSGRPIQKASINISGTFDEYFTDANGNFELAVEEGNELIVSYLGMYTTSVVVTSSRFYEVDLIPRDEVLDEVTLEGKEKRKEIVETNGRVKTFDAIGYDVKQLTQEDLGDRYATLGDALNGKFAGITARELPGGSLEVLGIRAQGTEPISMLIVIDNQIFDPNVKPPKPVPYIHPSRVKSINVIKGLAGGVKYGALARGGVVEIFTTNSFTGDQVAAQKSALVSGNDYKEEAVKGISKRVIASSRTTANTLVRGKVQSLGKPVQGANIIRKGTFDEYYSQEDGSFEMKASSGDVIIVKAQGMFKKEILIENQFNIVIELIPSSSDLDEVVVSGNKRVDNTIETAYGKENEDKIGYSVDQISSEDFTQGATNLRQLITGKFPGVRILGSTTGFSGSKVIYQIRGGNQSIENDIAPAWIINGVATDQEPDYLDVQQIESITVLKSTIATNKYGSLAAGGAFVITTKSGSSSSGPDRAKPSALVSGNNYVNDAIAGANLEEQEYISRLRKIPSVEARFDAYKRMARTKELSLEFYSDMARYFQEVDLQLADMVRSDLAYVARKNAKALRTLAYLYEEAGDTKKMLLAYEKVLELVPNESQSYRDVANAYVINQEYNKALEIYRNALGERIKGVDFIGIEPVLKTELSRLVQLYKDKIEFTRLPNEWLRADFKQDVRMVIEWSDASVPFEFQFVNPEKKFFKWNHTLEENRDRLQAEQKQGFQMEEFIIDDAPSGEWLINVHYLGDEEDYILPPFLKYTLYRNYGTPKETKEVRVIKLFRQTDKVTLAKLEI